MGICALFVRVKVLLGGGWMVFFLVPCVRKPTTVMVTVPLHTVVAAVPTTTIRHVMTDLKFSGE